MVGFDDAAMMGLGALNTVNQMVGAQQQKRQQKKLTKMGKAATARHRADTMQDIGLEQKDVDRDAVRDQVTLTSDIGDQQGPGGSYRNLISDRRETDRSERQQALERQKSRLQADWLDEDRARSIQKKIAKNAARMQMISGLLQQGGSSLGGGMA